MIQFRAKKKGVEVNGETVLSVVAGMRLMAKEVLSRNGIENPSPGAWYSQQDWLNAFGEISEKIGRTTLRMIGKKIPENANWPEGIDSEEKALPSIDVAYHMNHRIDGELMYNASSGEMKEGIGHYGFEKLPEAGRYKMVCDNPYPCDFDMGIIESTARKFSESAYIKVEHEEGSSCRNQGAQSCTYIVTV